MKVQSLAKALKAADKTVIKYRKTLQESEKALKDLVATPWKRPSATNSWKKIPVRTCNFPPIFSLHCIHVSVNFWALLCFILINSRVDWQ